jgi:ferredoxin--NADP+ reductase
MRETKYLAAIIGAGPAGLFAARYLSSNGVRVVMFNRDIKPGGLAEYGIYPDKIKMKEGLRKQFHQILDSPLIDYYGNVTVCCGGNIVFSDLFDWGFQVVVIATGAQGTKWLRMPGENLPGVYHAKDIVYHYNLLPPFSQRRFVIGRNVIMVGAGNVMMDLAHYLVHEKKVDEVTAVVRRGPADVKFTRKEMENVVGNLDLKALDAEFERVAPHMQAVGQDVVAAKNAFLEAFPKASERVSDTCLRFEFLASPVRILGSWTTGVSALKIEDNHLVTVDGSVKAQGSGITRQIEADTIIFAIGDTVDKDFCMPIYGDAYVVVKEPRFPVNDISYEAFDVDANCPMEKVFLAGWARQASTGLVGVARKDGENAAQAVQQYLQTQPPMMDNENVYLKFADWLQDIHPLAVTKRWLARLEAAEQAEAQIRHLEYFKFATNDEMLRAMGL